MKTIDLPRAEWDFDLVPKGHARHAWAYEYAREVAAIRERYSGTIRSQTDISSLWIEDEEYGLPFGFPDKPYIESARIPPSTRKYSPPPAVKKKRNSDLFGHDDFFDFDGRLTCVVEIDLNRKNTAIAKDFVKLLDQLRQELSENGKETRGIRPEEKWRTELKALAMLRLFKKIRNTPSHSNRDASVSE